MRETMLQKLLSALEVDYYPILVDRVVAEGATKNNCFHNVDAMVKKHGGECIYGWRIWEHPFMLEAEFHGIWKNPEGKYIDVTPYNILIKQTPLFFIDTGRVFSGRQVNNARLNITNNRLVDDLIALQDLKFKIENKGENAFSFDTLMLTEGEISVLKLIVYLIDEVLKLININAGPDAPCFCGSARSYQKCHGEDMVEDLKKIEVKIFSY